MTKLLENKVALVTGASGGIGSAVAKRLAEDGARILVHYNSDQDGATRTASEIEKLGGNAEIIKADLSQRESVGALFSQIDSSFGGEFVGRLDILINNAGTLTMGPLTEMSDEAFDRMFNVNVRSLFQLSREAAKRMEKKRWGRIVNMGSVFGEAAFFPGISLYAGSKFAVQGLTRGWSRDLGPFGITVNNIQPAVVQKEPQPTSGQAFQAMQQYTSVKRFGYPQEIAEAVAFLVSPKSGFINGESLTVDGGWSA